MAVSLRPGPGNLGLSVGLVLVRSRSRSKQLVETTKTSNDFKKLLILKMTKCGNVDQQY